MTTMRTNAQSYELDIPIAVNPGVFWNRLHSERENICEAMVKGDRLLSDRPVRDPSAANEDENKTINWRRAILQERLQKIDDALDRIMAGAYGSCCTCSQRIDDTQLEFDPANPFCLRCWGDIRRGINKSPLASKGAPSEPESSEPFSDVALATLSPYDTIVVETLNSEYCVMLLDPDTGRSLVEGGRHLTEPTEAFVSGSIGPGNFLWNRVSRGFGLEIWIGGRRLITSPVRSLTIKHNAVEPLEALAALN